MIYIFDSESRGLSYLADPALALIGRDVTLLREQRWLFFDSAGGPLRVDVLADGSMRLRPWASCSSCTLVQVLPFVMNFEDGPDELAALAVRLTEV